MDDEKVERVRRSAHLILDAVSVEEEDLTSVPAEAIMEALVQPLYEFGGVIVDREDETVDLTGLMLAVQFLVSALMHALRTRSGQEKLDVISELRELTDREWAPGEGWSRP